MFKNIFYKYITFASFILVFGFGMFNFVKAEETLPDNVKITTSEDGSSTTVIINSKPGFTTSVQTNCINGKCTNNAISKTITKEDIQKMQNNIKKHQEVMEKFWKMQEELFKQQQEMFDDLFGPN